MEGFMPEPSKNSGLLRDNLANDKNLQTLTARPIAELVIILHTK
jgi:hypothetical protein